MENIEKGLLLSYIGYKLKTPLQNTIGSVIFLKKLLKSQSISTQCTTDFVSEETEKYINIIEQSNSENISIINNIIDYSKLLLNKSVLNKENTNIRKCINDIFSYAYHMT